MGQNDSLCRIILGEIMSLAVDSSIRKTVQLNQAVILAAGNGSRLRKNDRALPKPLHRLGGLSLIKRTILTAERAGVSRFVVVLGFEGEKIAQSLQRDKEIQAELVFVHNSEYQKSNGVSLLAARPYIDGNFLLMMSDHVFAPELLGKMVQTRVYPGECYLGIDRQLDGIFDVEDATKVALGGQDGKDITEIGKELPRYQAYDTGIFACSEALLDSLEQVYQARGDVSLSEGMRELAQRGLAKTVDLSGLFWQDVDTPASRRYAEKILYQRLVKPTDGWVSRNINRNISRPLTKVFMMLRLPVNLVTGLVALIGVLSGVFVAQGTYPGVFWGGLFFNLASILDGCDGEMARLTMRANKTGEWLDTLGDNLTYLAFFAGVLLGVGRFQTPDWALLESGLLVSGIAMALGFLFYYLKRYTNSGSLVAVQSDLDEEALRNKPKGLFASISKVRFMMRRDFFALFFMALAMLNQLRLIVWLSIAGTHLTWMVLLAFKKEIFSVSDAKALPVK